MKTPEKVVLIGEAFMLAAALNFAGVKPVEAQTNTPTRTATPTPTPTRTLTELESAQSNLSVVQTRTEESKRLTAVRQQIDSLNGTPTPTRIPSATPTLGPDVVVIDRNALNQLIEQGVKIGVDAKSTVIAAEVTARPTPTPNPERIINRGNQDTGFPGILGVLLAGVAAGVGTLSFVRFRIPLANTARRNPLGVRVVNFAKARLHL